MFWGKDKNDKKSKAKSSDKRGASGKRQAGCQGGVTGRTNSQSLAGDALRAQALANARAARQHIGEDVLDKIAAAMTAKQQSAMEQAKRKLQSADPDRLLDELKFMLDTQKQK
ncbi:MAG: hypothetical protein ACPGRX_08615 [Bdellovibrionales bacterium]